MHEAEVSFRHLGTAEVRLWPFSHCLSAFFRSLHCLRSDLARKKNPDPWAGQCEPAERYNSAYQGVWEAGGWRQALGQGNSPGSGSLAGKSAQKRAPDGTCSYMPLGHPLPPSRAHRVSVDTLSPCYTRQHGPKPCRASAATSCVPVQPHSVNRDFDPQ